MADNELTVDAHRARQEVVVIFERCPGFYPNDRAPSEDLTFTELKSNWTAHLIEFLDLLQTSSDDQSAYIRLTSNAGSPVRPLRLKGYLSNLENHHEQANSRLFALWSLGIQVEEPDHLPHDQPGIQRLTTNDRWREFVPNTTDSSS